MLDSEFLADDDMMGVPGRQRPWSEAWIQYIIEYHVPDIDPQQKHEIVGMMKPLIDVAARSNIRRAEIPLHLEQYDIIWDKYFLYMKRGRKDPRLLVLRESLREAYDLQLNRSVEGEQMRLIFENRNIYNMLQQKISGAAKKLQFFKGKPPQEEM